MVEILVGLIVSLKETGLVPASPPTMLPSNSRPALDRPIA